MDNALRVTDKSALVEIFRLEDILNRNKKTIKIHFFSFYRGTRISSRCFPILPNQYTLLTQYRWVLLPQALVGIDQQ